jgi:alpha-1,6-mannosyltransferase
MTTAGSRTDLALGLGPVLFACAGGALLASEMALIWYTQSLTHATATTIASVLPLILGLAVPTALLLAMGRRLENLQPSGPALLVVFLVGLALRAAWFGAPAPLEDDFQRYLWDGALVANGLDPYRYAPDQFLASTSIPAGYEAIALVGRNTIEGIYFADLRTIYPSGAQLSFALAYMVSPFDIDGLRSVFVAAEIVTFGLLIAMLAQLKASPLWSALYWWNPTVAFALVGIAHVDALVPPLVLGALLMAMRGRAIAAVALLGAGAGVKIWPVLLVPLVLARIRNEPRRLALAGLLLVAVLAVAVGPVVVSALAPGSGLTAYAASWSNNNAFFAWAARLLGSLVDETNAQRMLRAAVALAGLAIALGAAYRAGKQPGELARASLIVAAAVFYLSPAQFPWYVAWFLPLAVLLRCWPLLLASATLPSYYLFYPLWTAGRGDLFLLGAAFLHSVPVLGWLLADALGRPRGEPAAAPRTAGP